MTDYERRYLKRWEDPEPRPPGWLAALMLVGLAAVAWVVVAGVVNLAMDAARYWGPR